MPEVIEIPVELTYFQLPKAVQERIQCLLDRQDAGEELTQTERQEAEGLVELAEFLSLLHLRCKCVTKQSGDRKSKIQNLKSKIILAHERSHCGLGRCINLVTIYP